MIEENIYINEIIRITYKCNWRCKFCNVLKTNNFWEKDVTKEEVIYKILELSRKYTSTERKNIILSFSWWEPTLNKNLLKYIELAKKIWIWGIQIQTNWTKLFKQKYFILKLIDVWLDEIFLAQHSWNEEINKNLWSFYNIDDFISWVKYVKEFDIHHKIQISFNIVVNKINLFSIYEYILFLKEIWFIDLLPLENNNWFLNSKRISFWLVQPNGYAEINKEEVLLKFNEEQTQEIEKIVNLCKNSNIYTDFHFTSPPLCILNYPEYNLEYQRLKNLENDIKKWKVVEWNLESYKKLWKEKEKVGGCEKCKYDKYCLWFYKNWIDFVWKNYLENEIDNFLISQKWAN
jgi:MoaA/NifB/PqqE/SkfB family radical SAM enzyme